MNATSREFPAPRVRANATHAFGGIWRLTVRRFYSPGRWAVLAAMLGVLVLFSIPSAPNHAAAVHGFLPWAARFYVCFLVPILAFISAAGVMRDDLGAGSVDYLFTRPVRRPAFVAFRYLAHVACAQLDFLLALIVVTGIGLYHEVPGLWAALPWLLLGQVMVIIAFSAFGFLCGMLTSRYVIIGLLYGAIVEVGVGNVPTQLNYVSMIRQILGLLRPVIGTEKNATGAAALELALGTPATLAVLLGFSAAMIGVTAAVFAFREMAGPANRDS